MLFMPNSWYNHLTMAKRSLRKKTTTKSKPKASAKSGSKIKNKNESLLFAARSVKASPFYIGIIVLWGVYLYLTLNSPNTSQSSLHFSPQSLILLKMSVAFPYLLTWLAAAYSVIKIKRYILAIKPSKESDAFNNFGWGIGILLGSLILSTFASSIRSFFVGYASMRAPLTIINNYSYVFPYLLAFIFLVKGAAALARQNGVFKISPVIYIVFGIPLIAFAYMWLELIFSNQFRVVAGGGSLFASYYLKDSMLVLTIVLPSLITWVLGLLAVMQLRMYYKKVTGIIYRKSLSSLFYGFISVIFASIFLQALLSLGARRLLDLGLEKLLFLIYLFLFLQAVGFLFISRGAKNLTKIEAV
jgi:hypothetical protein